MAVVLFDCDGVLVNTEVLAERNARAALAAIGLVYKDEDFERTIAGTDFVTFRKRVKEDYFAWTGLHLTEQFFDDMQTSYLVLEAAQIAEISGVRDLVESLIRSNVPFAICSNSNKANIERKLQHVGLYDFFKDRIISREDVTNGKPAPDIYLRGMNFLGEADPQKCIVVEDSAVGVTAGHAAGMRVLGYTGGSKVPDAHGLKLQAAGADFTGSSMAALAMEAFELIDMIDQGPNWRNAPMRAKRGAGGPAPT